jgi:phosphoglycolate phosphatase
MRLRLVIFDCDGVLVDSEPLSNRILVKALAELGLSITPEECCETFVGRSAKTNLKTIEKMLGSPLPPAFLAKLTERISAAFEKHLLAVPGIELALDAIAYPVCVASGSEMERIRQNLALTGLLDRFNGNIFSSEHVSNGKPAPDLFLHAAKVMQAKPEHCVVIEDSVAGVKAGCGAGMTVFAYAGTFLPDLLKEAGAHIVFEEMSKLPDLLAVSSE